MPERMHLKNWFPLSSFNQASSHILAFDPKSSFGQTELNLWADSLPTMQENFLMSS